MARRLLRDTPVFWWWKVDAPRLGAPAREAIAHAEVVLMSGDPTFAPDEVQILWV